MTNQFKCFVGLWLPPVLCYTEWSLALAGPCPIFSPISSSMWCLSPSCYLSSCQMVMCYENLPLTPFLSLTIITMSSAQQLMEVLYSLSILPSATPLWCCPALTFSRYNTQPSAWGCFCVVTLLLRRHLIWKDSQCLQQGSTLTLSALYTSAHIDYCPSDGGLQLFAGNSTSLSQICLSRARSSLMSK